MEYRVASRYVKSLLGLAVERKVVEEVHRDMQLFSKTCKENRSLVNLLRSPIIRHEDKRAILQKIFSGKVNELTMAMIDIVTLKNREPILPDVAEEFHNAYNEYKGIGKAQLATAVAPDKEFVSLMEDMAKKLSNRSNIELQTSIDSELLGGFVLSVGDRQIDASVRGKLKTLGLKFEEHYFVKAD